VPVGCLNPRELPLKAGKPSYSPGAQKIRKSPFAGISLREAAPHALLAQVEADEEPHVHEAPVAKNRLGRRERLRLHQVLITELLRELVRDRFLLVRKSGGAPAASA
jgi:hypothetical protein